MSRSVANTGEQKKDSKPVTGNTSYLGVTGSKFKLLPSRSRSGQVKSPDSKLNAVQGVQIAPRRHRSLDIGTRSPGSRTPGSRSPDNRTPPASRTPDSRTPPYTRSPDSRTPGLDSRTQGSRSPGSRTPGIRSLAGAGNPWQSTLLTNKLDVGRSEKKLLKTLKTEHDPSRESQVASRPSHSSNVGTSDRLLKTVITASKESQAASRPSHTSVKKWTVTGSASRELESGRVATRPSKPDPTVKRRAGAGVISRSEGRSVAPPPPGILPCTLGHGAAPPPPGPRALIQAKKKVHRNVRSKASGKKGSGIRAHYLERKFFTRWSRRVFGRVLPSVSRQHHAARCQRRVLRVWRDQWWAEHREWKLGIRADCHNRYRLWIKVWKAWTSHTHSRRLSKERNVLGMQFLRRVLLCRVWRGWRVYMRQRQVKKLISSYAAQWRLEALKRRCWRQWGQALVLRLREQATEEVALHHWATRLQGRAWQQWKQRYDQRLVEVGKMVLACTHWEKNSKLLVLRTWVAYVELRRYKMLLRGTAVSHHSSTLLLKTLSHWRNRFAWSRQISEFKEVVANRGRLSICRRVMVHWKFYVAWRDYKAHLCELAVAHYTLSLKCRSIQCLRQHSAQQQRQSQLSQLARAFHVRSRQRQCWGRWVQRCEHHEEMALGPLTRKARGHVGKKRAHKVMAAWVEYVIQCRHRKRLQRLSDEHFKACALPKCFEAFRRNVAINRYKQDLADESEAFRRETLLSMVFYKWWRASRLSQDLRMLERVAILHWEERAKRRLLVFLRERLRERLVWHEQEERAVQHSRETVVRRAFVTWRTRWLGVVSSASQLQRAASHDALVCSRKVWQHWSQYVCHKRERRANLRLADGHYQITVFTKVVIAWKEYHSRASVKSAKLREAVTQHQGWLQRHALHQWREGVEQIRRGRELYGVASSHHYHSNLLKHLRQWREVTVVRREQREREEEAVERARTHLTRLRAGRMLCVWRVLAEEEASERVRSAWASCHYQRSLRRRVLEAWRARHATLQRKSRLSAQCQCFERSRLLSGCYVKWRQQFMCALKFKQKVTVSLWHWSHMLEVKVLRAWQCYVAERRRKAERYAEAMQQHRAALVRLGVKQWIRFASARRSAREEAALNIQAKNSQDVLCCVRRCAQHWRQLARKHRPPCLSKFPSSSAGPAPPTSVPSLLDSTDVWTTLAKELRLPEPLAASRPQPRRPQPRRPEILTSLAPPLGESLPRLLPPPPLLVHGMECPNEVGGASLDVTDESSAVDQTVFPSTAGKLDVGSPPPSCTPSPSSHTLSPSLSGLPVSHPLRNAAVLDELKAMRRGMRRYYQLKLHQKSLRDELAQGGAKGHRLEVLKRELAEVTSNIQKREPLIKDMAAKVNGILQLCL